MASFIKNHKQRIEAEHEAIAARNAGESDITSPLADQMLVQLQTHRRELKALQSVARKEERKAEILPDYKAYVAAQLEADTGLQDDVLITVMIWYFDIGAFDDAFDIALYAIRHDLQLPERFRRDLPTFLLEETADHIIENLNILESQNTPPDPDLGEKYLGWINEAMALTLDMDMPDEVRAKGAKALGLSLLATQNTDHLEAAASHFTAAIKLDNTIGLKTRLKALQKQIAAKKAEEHASQAPT